MLDIKNNAAHYKCLGTGIVLTDLIPGFQRGLPKFQAVIFRKS